MDEFCPNCGESLTDKDYFYGKCLSCKCVVHSDDDPDFDEED